MVGFPFGCASQGGKPSEPKVDRKPAAAGRFYTADSAELRAELKEFFSEAKPRMAGTVQAVILPHAGYVFSGPVAASGINQVDPDRSFDNVFIIGSSHQVSFMGASIYDKGDYITPLGKVPVNTELADKLIRDNPVFCYNADADKYEHCVEVEVPFLQYHLRKPFRLVPIVLGTQSEQTCKKIGQALKPYFNGKNLFVISSDFSHYPAYSDAEAADKATCDAILANDPDKYLAFLDEYKGKDVPNLATNLCGWTSVLTLLYMTSADPGCRFAPVEYLNSGDSRYGDKREVVGYWAIAVTRTSVSEPAGSSFDLSRKDKETLLAIARNTIRDYVTSRKTPDINTSGFSDALKVHAGAFVTLKENGDLRGCIGRFTADVPLYQVVQEMAIASSTEDYRFSPVSPGEVDKIRIEISVLTPLKKITSPDEIVLGKHGIYIRKGFSSGTFLPQVATETGWSKEEFLGHCSRDKAGIGWDGWKTADIYTYEALVFSEEEISGSKD
jgi:MEMO1 family protein